MTNVRTFSLLPFAVAAAAAALGLYACSQNKPAEPTQGNVAYGTQQPGYAPPPGYGQPQGYPAQQGYPPQQGYPAPQQGYPQATQGYPAPQGYPTATPAPGTMPTAGQPTAGQPVPGQPAPAGSAGAYNPMDPNVLGQMAQAGAAVLGQPGAAGSLGGDPTELGIKAAATRFAPGMQPEGPAFKQTVQEGQHASTMVPMQGGKCYTIIGFSPPMGGVRDLNLTLLAPPLYTMPAGQDKTADATPVIGPGKEAICPIVPFAVQYKLDVFAKSGSGPVAVQVYSKTK